MKIVNKTVLEDGGILLLAENVNNKVVTSIEVFNPIRSATEPGSFRPNKKDTAQTKAKMNGGIKGA